MLDDGIEPGDLVSYPYPMSYSGAPDGHALGVVSVAFRGRPDEFYMTRSTVGSTAPMSGCKLMVKMFGLFLNELDGLVDEEDGYVEA